MKIRHRIFRIFWMVEYEHNYVIGSFEKHSDLESEQDSYMCIVTLTINEKRVGGGWSVDLSHTETIIISNHAKRKLMSDHFFNYNHSTLSLRKKNAWNFFPIEVVLRRILNWTHGGSVPTEKIAFVVFKIVYLKWLHNSLIVAPSLCIYSSNSNNFRYVPVQWPPMTRDRHWVHR